MNSVDTLVSDLPESVTDTTVATWHKESGDATVCDEVLAETEIDKVVLEAPASIDDILDTVLGGEGTTIAPRRILGRLREGSSAGKEASAKSEEKVLTLAQHQQASLEEQNNGTLSLVIRRLLAEYNLDASAIKGIGVGGRLTREDVERHLAKAPAEESAPAAAISVAQPAPAARSEKRVPMIRLHKRVVERLLETKNFTAILTTFNEVNMKPIMDPRKQYGEAFEKRHSTRLGFTSFYVKAVIEALKRYPEVDASIDGDDVVYHNHFDVSMAVSTPCGSMTPVPCDVDTLGMAGTEKKIKELIVKGRGDKLIVEDLIDGNFTITNGGVFDSPMFTPTISPPQSVILDMYVIRDRLMVVNGQVEILPMTYLALPYDHRPIDGREPVGFLITTEELLEDPTRLLLGVQQFKFHLRCRPDKALSSSPAIKA